MTTLGLGAAHPDPTMELYSGATLIQQNDNWQTDDGRTAGAFPLLAGSKDAVLPAWSPDGTKVAWLQKDGRKKYQLQVASVLR